MALDLSNIDSDELDQMLDRLDEEEVTDSDASNKVEKNS